MISNFRKTTFGESLYNMLQHLKDTLLFFILAFPLSSPEVLSTFYICLPFILKLALTFPKNRRFGSQLSQVVEKYRYATITGTQKRILVATEGKSKECF